MKLAEAMRANKGIGPGFHMLRHALSWAILTTHAWYAMRGTEPPKPFSGAHISANLLSQMSAGDITRELFRPSFFALVGMFFALSGFLVAGSAVRTGTIRTFLVNRALRILPALSVEVTLSALILGPIFTTYALGVYFTDHQFFRYFGNIVGHITYELPGVFNKNPWPNTVNATLWTLPAELWCYVIMLALMLSGMILHNKRFTIIVAAITLITLILTYYDPVLYNVRDGVTHFAPWYIVIIFLFGAVLFVNAETIPVSPTLFIASAAVYYILMVSRIAEPLSGLPLAYCTIYIGMKKFPAIDKLIPFDLSYGIYLYGFPITQAIIYILLPHVGHHGGFFAFLAIYPIIIILTVIFSAMSWTFLEKPVLSLRKHFLREPPQNLHIPETKTE